MHVCIIGGGVIGISTAYYLAQQGYQITVLERHDQSAMETSYANGAQLSYSYVAPLAGPGVMQDVPKWLLRKDSPLRFVPRFNRSQTQWLLAFMKACNANTSAATTEQLLALSYLSRDTLNHVLKQDPFDFKHLRNGKLIVYRNANAFLKAKKQADYQASLGADQQVLDAQQTLAIEPSLISIQDSLVGSIYTPSEESGDCHLFTQALCERLQHHPLVTLKFNTEVKKIHTSGHQVTKIETNQGDVYADAYVMAAGVHSNELLSGTGYQPLLYPLKGYSLSVPIGNKVLPKISVTDYERRIVYARLGDTLRIAAMVDIGDTSMKVNDQRMALLKQQVLETFPDLDLSQATEWAGLRPATPTGRPILGLCPNMDNLWLNIGQGALGFTLAMGSAVVLHHLISGTPAPINIQGFQP